MTRTSLLATILLGIQSSAWAINPHDDYYSGDIFEAIEEAKKRPHHYDYSRQKRYNRTTTQSIEIPKLMNREMADMSIKSPVSNQSTEALETHQDKDDESTLEALSSVKGADIQNGSQQVQTAPLNLNPNVNNQGSISVISRP